MPWVIYLSLWEWTKVFLRFFSWRGMWRGEEVKRWSVKGHCLCYTRHHWVTYFWMLKHVKCRWSLHIHDVVSSYLHHWKKNTNKRFDFILITDLFYTWFLYYILTYVSDRTGYSYFFLPWDFYQFWVNTDPKYWIEPSLIKRTHFWLL